MNPTRKERELSRVFFSAVPRYEYRGVLGSGGMGTVFEAWDTDLDSEVAIKVLSVIDTREKRWEEDLRRLKNEVIVNRRLKHHTIARTFDYSEAAGMPYLTMELIHGSDLRQILGERRLSLSESLEIMRQVAQACAAAHSASVVHRDLKPENIMVQPDGRVVVLDFGLSRFLDQERLTPHGGIAGTPTYMSPEQLTGAPSDVRADVYAFGIVFYELLTGHPLFLGGTSTEVGLRHINEVPNLEPLRQTQTPEHLMTLISRCLEKRPENRPANGAELLEKLEALPEAIEFTEVPLEKRSVLIVDDDPLIRRILSTLASKLKAEVIEAPNGEAALVLLSKRLPNLVLLDLVMPVMDGFDTLSVIRSTPGLSRTPVVLVSAFDDRQNRAFGKNIGANGFLEKPLDLPRVKRVMEQWLA